MIPIIAFDRQSVALLLANYLRKQNIDATVIESSDSAGFQVAITNPSHRDEATRIAQAFIQEPSHPRYQQAAWDSGEQVKLKRTKPTVTLSELKACPVVTTVLIACTLVFILSVLGFFASLSETLSIQPLPIMFENQQWWRLFTPAFLHFSVLHIVFNLLWWWILGKQLESKFGSTFLIVLFMLSAFASNVGQLLVTGPNFGGLSGVVYALLGFVWWIGWLRPSWGIRLPKSIIGFMLVWLLLGYANVLWMNVANTAHTVGLISGCVLAVVTVQMAGRQQRN